MPHEDDFHPSLKVFEKLPLGGTDRRSIVATLAEKGPSTARADLAASRAKVSKHGVSIADDACVLLLGGSNGILRAVAIQLLFGEGVSVFCVHRDSEQMQIGVHHAAAIEEAAKEVKVPCTFRNDDALRPQTIEAVVQTLKEKYRAVHLIDGIAAGAMKRMPEFGPTKVRDLDVAFDPVRQVPDYSKAENVRRAGLVEVPVVTPLEIERTLKMMGSGAYLWSEQLAAAGLLVPGESVVAFADYDYEKDDPVYAKGPLAMAKNLQRERMDDIHQKYGVRTVRLCYPVMNTTAIGTIPGGCVMFAGNAQVGIKNGTYRNLRQLARDTMQMWQKGETSRELRMDVEYQKGLAEFHELKRDISETNYLDRIKDMIGYPDL
jgi:enoyl-[acyl-carrier protein] reductase / trans-2-enoyl-CoA reductase (NAD+)